MTIEEFMKMATRQDEHNLNENLSHIQKREFGSVKDDTIIGLMGDIGLETDDIVSMAYIIVISEAYFIYRTRVIGLAADKCMSKKEESSDSELDKEKEDTDEY